MIDFVHWLKHNNTIARTAISDTLTFCDMEGERLSLTYLNQLDISNVNILNDSQKVKWYLKNDLVLIFTALIWYMQI